jgi:hemerythrin superfamily protein
MARSSAKRPRTAPLTTVRTHDAYAAGGGIPMPRRNGTRRASARDAIALLKEDHAKVRKLLAQLESSSERSGNRRQQLLSSIEQELKLHTRMEEELFYPAFRHAAQKKDDRELYFEAIEEHHVVDLVLPEIKKSATGSEQFAAKAKVLRDLVEHHASEEEREMFPRAKKLMDREELVNLGERLAQAKTSLMKDRQGLGKRLAQLVSS